jgi:hypothetical protein
MRFVPLLLAFTLTACVDSDPNRHEISGTVTRDGKPVDSGTISFTPVDGTTGPRVVGTISGGKFRVEAARGPFAGMHRVRIQPGDLSGNSPENRSRSELSGPGEALPMETGESRKLTPAAGDMFEFNERVSEIEKNVYQFELGSENPPAD